MALLPFLFLEILQLMSNKLLHTWDATDGLPIVTRWEVANEAARLALTTSTTPVPLKIGGIAHQLDENSFYVCVAVSGSPSSQWKPITDFSTDDISNESVVAGASITD